MLHRAALMTPGVYDSPTHLLNTRLLLESRARNLAAGIEGRQMSLGMVDEFSLSPTFYLVYQGFSDRQLLQSLQNSYSLGTNSLGDNEIGSAPAPPRAAAATVIKLGSFEFNVIPVDAVTEKKRIKVGFVSSHFRRHSICKLFCGIITGLDPVVFDVFVFSAVKSGKEDSYTEALRRAPSITFVDVGMMYVTTRKEVISRQIDVLVYLDVGMEPTTPVWAASRLAPVQICTWGHPSTTGMLYMDYFVSSDVYHLKDDAPPLLKTSPSDTDDAAIDPADVHQR
jgi:hypothetical protein